MVPPSERFVPRRLSRLIDDLARHPWTGPGHGAAFTALARLISALYHYEFHAREQAVVEAWHDLDHDPGAAARVTAELTGLLDGANYELATTAELDEALERESLIPLRLEVDFDDYDEVLIARRGSHTETVEVATWQGLRTEERAITVDERVVVHTRVKDEEWFAERQIDPADRNLRPGHVSLKHFQNVPRADIEMLLPSARVRFRRIDSVIVGVPAVASGVVVLVTKLLPTLGLMFLLIGAWLGLRSERPVLDQTSLVLLFGGALTLGGFLFRQWNKLKNRRVRYLKTLSENLYFRTIGDGPGVLHALLAAAEEQEVAEVLLAYRMLLDHPQGMTAAELDAATEAWLANSGSPRVDFEVDDAIAKLARLQIIEGATTHRAVPIDRALATLDERWDDLFTHRRGDHDAGAGRTDGDGGPNPDPLALGDDRARARRPLISLRRVVDRFSGRLGGRRRRRHDPTATAPVSSGVGQ